MGGLRLPPADANYVSEIENYPTWIVEAEASILGGLIMSFDNGRAAIVNIAVDPGCQGQGIGGTLMQFAETKAKQNGFSELHLTTHVLLHENIAWYRHLGWEETGRNDDKVFMKKDL